MQRLITVLLLVPGMALAGNFATCLLDKLPGLQSDTAAQAAYQVCLADYPGGMASVGQGSGRGFFSHDSGAECTLKKASETRSQRAGQMIGYACRTLYDEPKPDLTYDPNWRPPAKLRPFNGTLDPPRQPFDPSTARPVQ